MDLNEKGIATQLANIQEKTGKSLDELRATIQRSGLTKHGEIRAMLQGELGLSFVHADTLILCLRQMDEERAGTTPDDVVDAMYTGAKSALRPIHDKLMIALQDLGPFEIAPKKGYVSLRRKKQFAMLGPKTNTRVEVGLNLKGIEATERLAQLPAGDLCTHRVRVTEIGEVDGELAGWIRQAYERAG